MNAALRRLAGRFESVFGPPRHSPPESTAHRGGEAIGFADVQRSIGLYLRALWDTDFIIRLADASAGSEAGSRPTIEDGAIVLPARFIDGQSDGGTPFNGRETYRAAAVHVAAHLVFSAQPFSARSLDRLDIATISAIEDARVEALAIRRFPGLGALWAAQHRATSAYDLTAGDYLLRLARALLDPGYRDVDPWIGYARDLVARAGDLADAAVARDIGVELAGALRKKGIKLHLQAGAPAAPYRDDNRYLWDRSGPALEVFNPYLKGKAALNRDAPAKTPKPGKRASAREEDGRELLGTYFYPEWNYRSQAADLSWVTLRETNCELGDPKDIDAIVDDNRHLVSRIKSLLQALRDGSLRRLRKLESGDEIDVNAAVRAWVDQRLGRQPDTRVMMRSVRRSRDVSVLMLLDMSGSMNDKVQGGPHTALQLTRQVSALLADAIASVGDSFAIHGFSSDGRHKVEYYRMKDFDQSYNDVAKARIAGMACQLNTRMGAAIRHATWHLGRQKSAKKLLILFTDGEPSDMDVPDKKYLRDDTRKSVQESIRAGVHVYCVTFDPKADEYVTRIFDARNYLVLDHIRHLPEKLLLLYAGLTR
jgi:nitric oxide reductase NorD protein